MKRACEQAGLSLTEVSGRSGIDKAELSRLENGHNANPTLDTLWRYAAAIGKRLLLHTEAIEQTREKTTAKSAAQTRVKKRFRQPFRKGS